jgi:uroporphyrinogen decarboxylase
VVPQALGRTVTFEAGEGPRLEPIADVRSLTTLRPEVDQAVLAPVYETIRLVKANLPVEVALLGFCGAPWTVATYMVAGQSTADQAPARLFAYAHPHDFQRLIGLLVEASVDYLVRQLQVGVDAVQIFDTWAGVLPPPEFKRWCIEPVRQVVAGVRRQVPGARIIGFPRAAGTSLAGYAADIPVDALGLDWMVDPVFVREQLPAGLPVQGNLDPLVLRAGGDALDHGVDAVLAAFADRPLIFNLGHGILPETPIAHVEQMVGRVRGR